MVLCALWYSPSTLLHIYTFMMADDGTCPWVIFLTSVVLSSLGCTFVQTQSFRATVFDTLSMATELISHLRLASPLNVNCYWAP